MRREAIPTCIVDEHHDVVPFLFALMRSGKLPIPPSGQSDRQEEHQVLLVHIDAHPDLQSPSSSECSETEDTDMPPSFAKAASDSHGFLDQLYSSSGAIAEFILPLLYNRYITSVTWVRSPWSDQLDDGEHCFMIGDTIDRGSAAVTLPASYYFDEGVVYAADDLDEHRKVEVNVLVETMDTDDNYDDHDDSEKDGRQGGINEICKPVESSLPSSSSRTWILDICLDFFSTINPFYLELRDLFTSEGISEDLIDVVKRICSSLAYRSDRAQSTMTYSDRREQRLSAEEALRKLLEDHEVRNVSLHNLSERFHPYLAISDTKIRDELILDFLSLMTTMSGSTRRRVLEIGHLINLPHHISTKGEIDSLMEKFEDFLTRRVHKWGLPACVTIARSAEVDNYTPMNQVDEIQETVLKIVENVLKNMYSSQNLDNSELHGDILKIHDLSMKEDEFDVREKCLTLFISKACKRRMGRCVGHVEADETDDDDNNGVCCDDEINRDEKASAMVSKKHKSQN